jgi:hypothetical protein
MLVRTRLLEERRGNCGGLAPAESGEALGNILGEVFGDRVD